MFIQQGQTHINQDKKHHSQAQRQYALMMLLPPQGKPVGMAMIPREVVFVIDTSGSMSGEAIEQAKAAIIYGLAGLSSRDSFNVLQFNSQVEALSATPLKVNPNNIGAAQAYVKGLQADGGTEMSLALTHALLQQSTSKARLRQVLFMTDGAVSNESQLFEQLREQLQHSRLFTIGIGAAPNAHFMQRAAQLGRGTYTYIGKGSEVKSKMVAMLDKLEKPAMTDIEIRFADGTIPDYWPVTIPDLYENEPLMVALKLPNASGSALVVSGQMAGQLWQQSVPFEGNREAKGLDLVWARKHIAALALSKEAANQARIEKQITAISLNYHVMSAYTSLVAVDHASESAASKQVMNARVIPHVPQGWQRLPQTATNSMAMLIFGGTLLLLALLYWLSFTGLSRHAKEQR